MSRSHLTPPHLTPSPASRSASPSSRLSNPTGPSHAHPQHDTYISSTTLGPSLDDFAAAEVVEEIEDYLEDHAENGGSDPGSPLPGVESGGLARGRRKSVVWADESDSGTLKNVSAEETGAAGNGEQEEYDPREGSISRRSAWRKPSPMKLLPAIAILAVCLGMGAAPKQELYINLACLAHPPQTQSVYPPHTGFSAATIARSMLLPASHHSARSDSSGAFRSLNNGTGDEVVIQPLPSTNLPPLSPADKWMLDVQRRIAAEERRRRRLASHQSPLPSATGPATMLPRPSGPVAGVPGKTGGEGNGEEREGEGGEWEEEEEDEEWERNHPDEVKPGEIDPRLCKKSPETQAAAARLSMVMILCMGVLSALTTGFWGSLSDRHGRTKVMTIAILGLVISDIVLLITAAYPDRVPGGYKFLVLGPLIDGALGGFSTISATINAYLSDTTPDGSRAKFFSRFTGIMMIGFAVGPIVGSAVIKATGNLMIVFYIAAIANSCFATYVFLFLPESLSSEARTALSNAADAKALRRRQKEQAEREWEDESEDDEEEEDDDETDHGQSGLSAPVGGDSGWSRLSTRTTGTNASGKSKRGKKFRGNMRRLRRRTLAFLAPLALFLPRERRHRQGGKGKDWNLTFMAMGAFCLAMLMGVMQLKSQYVIFTYGWTSVELGPYMSLMGGVRASMLLIVFPLIVAIFKPKILTDVPLPTLSESGAPPPSGPGIYRSQQTLADAKFDLIVLRISLLVDAVGYLALSFVLPVPAFLMGSVFVSFGAAAGPSMNSLALNLIDSSKEAGKLFGGLSVLNAMSSTFLGPLIFSLTFANTVSFYPPTIFAVASGLLVVSFVLFSMVRLPRVRSAAGPERERGRKRRVKRVNSSAEEVEPLMGAR